MYWERDQEITLLHLVLESLDPEEDRGSADMIISGLIEMALVDMDRAPAVQQAWNDEWDGFDVPFEWVRERYINEDDLYN
jgi:hypothetical protein